MSDPTKKVKVSPPKKVKTTPKEKEKEKTLSSKTKGELASGCQDVREASHSEFRGS